MKPPGIKIWTGNCICGHTDYQHKIDTSSFLRTMLNVFKVGPHNAQHDWCLAKEVHGDIERICPCTQFIDTKE